MTYSIILLPFLLLMSLSLPVASAAVNDATVKYYADIHNSRIDNAPQILKSLIGSVRIDLNITRDDGSIYRTGLEMEDARVSMIAEGGIDDPAISINATEDAVNRTLCSDDPLATFLQEMNSGGIAIRMHHTQKDAIERPDRRSPIY